MIDLPGSKLVRLLKNLTSDEMGQLEKFLNSPYFNKSQVLLTLFSNLSKYYPQFDQVRFNAQAIFKKTFPKDEKYKQTKLRNRMYQLTSLVFKFLSVTELDNSEKLHESLLMKSLSHRNDIDLFKQVSLDHLSQVEQNPSRDSGYYAEKASINHSLYLKSIELLFIGDRNYLTDAVQHLDRFYVLRKLEYACGLLSREQITAEENDLSFIGETIKWGSSYFEANDPVFKIYVLLITLYQSGIDDEIFDQIDTNFKHHSSLIGSAQKAAILYHLLNYTNKRFNADQIAFLKKQHQLYKFGLTHGLFLQDGHIPEKTFLNMAVTAALAKDFDFLSKIIEEDLKMVSENEQLHAGTLAKAFLAFHLGDFEKAYRLVFQLDESSLHYKLRIRLLKLRCLYEMQLKDESYLKVLMAQITTFERFISRESTLNQPNKNIYNNFTKSLKSILNRDLMAPLSIIKPQLIQKVKAMDAVMARRWLFDKINQL